MRVIKESISRCCVSIIESRLWKYAVLFGGFLISKYLQINMMTIIATIDIIAIRSLLVKVIYLLKLSLIKVCRLLNYELTDHDDGNRRRCDEFYYVIENLSQSHVYGSAVGEFVFEILFFNFPTQEYYGEKSAECHKHH